MGLNVSDIARLGPAARAQVLQKLGAAAKAKESKYHNQPAKRGNIHFDSQKEARRYDELMLLLKAGDIRNLRLQAQFTLKESYITPSGLRVRAIRYVADFTYEMKVGEYWMQVVEDVKSTATKTAQYEMKKKLMLDKFGIVITEV